MLRVIAIKPLPGYRLWIRFSDGLEGAYAVEPDRRSGVFQHLCDSAVFERVRIDADFGCVEWPGGVDPCPSAMHADVASMTEK